MSERIPRKSGQPAKSDKHSDLYTDEDPKGTIHGLKFATPEDAKASVSKIKSSGRSHAHKMQAAIAMEQRAKVMGKAGAAAVYRSFINSMKDKTEEMRETWSQKYKKSIDCSNPKGFSQKAHCQGKEKKMKENIEEAVKMTALERFRKAAAEREKKHAEIEKKQSKDGSGLTAAIDRLSKQVNKEEVELDEVSDTLAANYVKKRTSDYVKTMKGQVQPSDVYNKMSDKHKTGINRAMDRIVKPVKEEVELNEAHKVGDSVIVNSKFFGKQKGKVVKVDNQSVHVQRNGKKFSEKYPHDSVMKEDSPTNAAGTGAIAGLGVGPQGEPGVNMKKKKKVIPFAMFTRMMPD